MGLRTAWDDLKWKLWGERRAFKVLGYTPENQSPPQGGSVSFQELGTLVREADAAGLGRAFSRAGDWDSRETIVVAFSNLMAAHPDLSGGARAELRSALESVVARCRAEQGGGSYRQNCVSTAERLLGELKES